MRLTTLERLPCWCAKCDDQQNCLSSVDIIILAYTNINHSHYAELTNTSVFARQLAPKSLEAYDQINNNWEAETYEVLKSNEFTEIPEYRTVSTPRKSI